MEPYRRPTPSPPPRRKPRSTSFSVSLAKYDDIRRLVDIEFFAFEKERTNHILSYRDYRQPAHLERAVRSYQSAIGRSDANRRRRKSASARRLDRRSNGDVVRFRKVTDRETGLIISWAKTETKAYTQDELASPPDSGHENEALMNRDWFALNEKLKRDYMGTQKHCYISMLATQPTYQHHGAGTMLLEDILTEADEAGVECYLEATDTAKPLYEKHGFEMVNELRFDPSAYGVCGFSVERQTIMVRGALDRVSEQRKQVRSWAEATGGPGSPTSESDGA